MFQFRSFRHPGCYSRELIYTLIHGRDPIPCRTTYIEYKSQGEDSPFFYIGTPPNSIGCHCKVGFFNHSSTTPVVGGPFGEPQKLIFLIQYKTKLIISGDLFFCWNVLGTSDIQGCCSPKGITYIIYTLIHERDPVPCRITYIEYRSPVSIFIHFSRNTTQFRWRSLQHIIFS